MYAKNTQLIALGEGSFTFISEDAQNMAPAPSKCMTPRTRWAAKNRSATIPTNNGVIIAAIGPTE